MVQMRYIGEDWESTLISSEAEINAQQVKPRSNYRLLEKNKYIRRDGKSFHDCACAAFEEVLAGIMMFESF